MKILTIEHRQKLREAKLLNPTRSWLGKKRAPVTEETKEKMRKAMAGKKFPFRHKKSRGGKEERSCKVCKASFMAFKSARHWHCSKECNQTSRCSRRGELNPAWKGGVTPENNLIRHSIEYRLWREAVFARDNFTCQGCGLRGCELHADHIKPFSLFPELRLAIDNGRTLCVPCHAKTDTYKGRIHAYKLTLNK